MVCQTPEYGLAEDFVYLYGTCKRAWNRSTHLTMANVSSKKLTVKTRSAVAFQISQMENSQGAPL